jgi:small membrane protein
MLIRIILLSAIALIAYFAFLRRHKAPLHIMVVFGVLAVAAGLVIAPELSSNVAHKVGVGRGVDLINYIVQLAVIFIVIHYFTKFVELNQQITRLTREMAFLRARLEEKEAAPPAVHSGSDREHG